jgi:glycogen synthase
MTDPYFHPLPFPDVPPPPQDQNPLHIVHLAAELAPFAKVGGLADVVTGLAKACGERCHSSLTMFASSCTERWKERKAVASLCGKWADR